MSLVLLSPIAQILVQYAHTLPRRALPRRLLGSVGRRVRSHDGSWCKSPSGSFDGVFSLLSFYHNYHCSTSMIAAQLIPLPFTPIRVELRHTNAEDPISAQIEEQIQRDTDKNFDWTTLCDHTVNGPALVLFD